MSFKIHLIIVCFIIVAVYLAWRLMTVAPPPVLAPAAPVKQSAFSINVIHASWGLNCPQVDTSGTYAQSNAASKLHDDNVLEKVAALCNGKPACTIPITSAALGGDPAPACTGKVLDVEYRCFSYDRPWDLKSTSSVLMIDCENHHH